MVVVPGSGIFASVISTIGAVVSTITANVCVAQPVGSERSSILTHVVYVPSGAFVYVRVELRI